MTNKTPPLAFARERDMKRVLAAVQAHERAIRSRLSEPFRRRNPSWPAVLFRATADIANGAAATCNRVDIDLDDYSLTEDTARQETVLNLCLPKIWNDCYLIAQRLDAFWVATLAYSATRIWGQLTAACTGGTFSIDGVVGLDGEYPAGGTISNVENPAGFEGDEDGDAWIEWDDTNERWQAYQLQCQA